MTKVRRSEESHVEPAELPWYSTPYPYIGAALLALVICDVLGRNNPTVEFYAGTFTFAYMVAVAVMVLRSAKEDGMLHVLLILLLPPYTLFYVCTVNKDKSLIVLLFSGWAAMLAFAVITLHLK